MSRIRDIAAILGRSEARNTDNKAFIDSATSVTIASITSGGGGGSGVTTVNTQAALPAASANEGQIYYVENINKFFFSNGNNWFQNDLINNDPTLTVTPTGTINLAKDGATTTTFIAVAADSSNIFNFSVDSDGNFAGLASGVLTQADDSARFVVTPKAQVDATTQTSRITFNVSDAAASTVSASRDLRLVFSTEGSNADGSYQYGYDNVTYQFKQHSNAQSGNYYGNFFRKNQKSDKVDFLAGSPYHQVSNTYNVGTAEFHTWVENSRNWLTQSIPSPDGTGGYYFGGAGAIGDDYSIVQNANTSGELKLYYLNPNRTGTYATLVRSVAATDAQTGPYGGNSTYYTEFDTDNQGLYWFFGDGQNAAGGTERGKVFVRKRTGSSSTWDLGGIHQTITDPTPQNSGRFGTSLKASNDGMWLAIGSNKYGTNATRSALRTGGVHLYKRNNQTDQYVHQQTLTLNPSGSNVSAMGNNTNNGNALYTPNITMDSDGGTVVVGYPSLQGMTEDMYPPGSNSNQYAVNSQANSGLGDNTYLGIVQVWKRDSANGQGSDAYSLLQEMWPDSAFGDSAATGPGAHQPGARDFAANWSTHYGSGLDITADGNTIIIGSPTRFNGTLSYAGWIDIWSLDSAKYTNISEIRGPTASKYSYGGGGPAASTGQTGAATKTGILVFDNGVIVARTDHSTSTTSGFHWFDSGY
jgi:hypothetical protein